MKKIDQQIRELQSQITRQIQLEDLLSQWTNELRELKPKVDQLRRIRDLEQQDVDKLENGGLSTMVHKLLGTMDEKMDKERQEAQDATDNYTTALNGLQALQKNIASAEAELETLKDCQDRYQQIMEEKIKYLTELSKSEQREKASSILESLIRYEKRRKTLREALIHSQLALNTCQKTLTTLEAANSREAQDMEEPLTDAAAQAEVITDQITHLQAKLAQMGVDPQEHLHIGEYLRAPKIYIAGPSEEFSRSEQISKAIEQIAHLQVQVQTMADKLDLALSQIEEFIFKNQVIYEEMTV